MTEISGSILVRSPNTVTSSTKQQSRSKVSRTKCETVTPSSLRGGYVTVTQKCFGSPNHPPRRAIQTRRQASREYENAEREGIGLHSFAALRGHPPPFLKRRVGITRVRSPYHCMAAWACPGCCLPRTDCLASLLASNVISRSPNSTPIFLRKSVGGSPPAKIHTKSLAIS